MHKARSKKPQSKLRFWLLVLIMLLTGIVATLFSSPQARHLLRAQLSTSSPAVPAVGGYWPDVYDDIYINYPSSGITDVYQNWITDIAACGQYFPDFIQCVATTPLDDYYAAKFAAECKALHPNDPWAQITCVSAKLTAYYDTTKAHECCRNYALDMQKIIPLLQWGDAKVTVGMQSLGMTPPPNHLVNKINITIPTGPYAGKTFSYMYDAGWFPLTFYPTNPDTRAYYYEHGQYIFPYFPPSTPSPSAPTPVPSAPPANFWNTRLF